MLTDDEKNVLYLVIVSVIGEDPSIKQSKGRFNLTTVSIVEKMVKTSKDCNKSMEALVSGLFSPAAFRGTGWLIRLLKLGSVVTPQKNLSGLGCKVTVKAKWKTPILISAI